MCCQIVIFILLRPTDVLFIWFTWFTIGCVYRYLYRGSQEAIKGTFFRPVVSPSRRFVTSLKTCVERALGRYIWKTACLIFRASFRQHHASGFPPVSAGCYAGVHKLQGRRGHPVSALQADYKEACGKFAGHLGGRTIPAGLPEASAPLARFCWLLVSRSGPTLAQFEAPLLSAGGVGRRNASLVSLSRLACLRGGGGPRWWAAAGSGEAAHGASECRGQRAKWLPLLWLAALWMATGGAGLQPPGDGHRLAGWGMGVTVRIKTRPVLILPGPY